MNNPQLHKNWMVRVHIIVYIIACFAACIPTNESFDPYLTDRSQDWNVSVIVDVTIKPHSLNQTQIEEDAFVKSVLYRDEVPPFKADVSDEEKALVAVKELLTSCYNEQNIWDSMILIDHNYDDTLCLINYCSYYFIFDKQGNLIVSINGDNYPDLRIQSIHTIHVMFDLAQAQPDSLALNEKSAIRDQLKGLLPDSEELDTPEDAFQTAIYLAEKYPFLIGGYQNEFIVYQNPSGNWWIVLSSRWVIVLSKGNGDLIFAATDYDYEDLSLPLTG